MSRPLVIANDVILNRYYDPVTSQFLTKDPLVDTTGEPYGYVEGNPVNGTDPSGLICFHNPFGHDKCNSFWKQNPAIQKPLIVAAAAPLVIACVAGGCEAAAAVVGGAEFASTASNVATGLADADVGYNCVRFGFGSRACQVGIITGGITSVAGGLPYLANLLPSVDITDADRQLFALLGLSAAAVSGFLSNEMQCPGASA